VIPGSDPLPLAGEERYAGTYGFIYQGAFDASRPAAAIGHMLTGSAAAIMPVGARCGTWAVARRLKRLREAKNRHVAPRRGKWPLGCRRGTPDA